MVWDACGFVVLGVRSQFHCAAKLRSDPQNQAAPRRYKCFRPLAPVIRAQAAMKIVATASPEPVPESESEPPPQNPCECAEERKPRRNRARDCLSAASSSGTPLEASTARLRLLGSDTDFAAMQSIAPAGRAIGSANSGSDPKNRSRHQGRLFFAYFLLAKQKKVGRPPRRQSGTGTVQNACSFNGPKKFGFRHSQALSPNSPRLRRALRVLRSEIAI